MPRVIELAREHRQRQPLQIIDALHQSICNHARTNKLEDDVTIAIIKSESTSTDSATASKELR